VDDSPSPTEEPENSATPSLSPTDSSYASLTLEQVFQMLPSIGEVESWGFPDLKDAVYAGERINGVFSLAEATDAQRAVVTAGGWTSTNPEECAAIAEFIHPRDDSGTQYVGVSWYENDSFVDQAFALVQYATWETPAKAQEVFESSASVAEECGEFSMLSGGEASSVLLWQKDPKIAETWLRGIEQSKGTLLGVRADVTYQVIVLADRPRRVLNRANDWIQSTIDRVSSA